MRNKHAEIVKIFRYTVFLFFSVYLFSQILNFKFGSSDSLITSGMYFIEFGVHELSHMMVFFLPAILVAAAGSFGEITFTFLLLTASYKAKNKMAMIFSSLWVMLAMNSVGLYMADARTQLIPLAGPSGVKHDWNYVFGELGWLGSDTLIGNAVRYCGDLIGVAALLFAACLLSRSIKEILKK